MDRPLFRIGGYVLFGVVSFLVALLVTFPDGAIKQIAAVQIEHQLEKNMQRHFEVEVGDLDLWWIGLELEDLSISEREAEAVDASSSSASSSPSGSSAESSDTESNPNEEGDGEDATPALQITVPSIGARFAPLSSLLNLGLSAKYHLGLGGGSLSGTYTQGSSSQRVYVSINDLNLDQSPLLVQFTGVPMFGSLSGGGTFHLAANRPVVTGGDFELTGRKITIGPEQELKLEALPFGHASIPQVNFGNMELTLNIEEREKGRPRIVLEEWRSKGRDLQLQIWGPIDRGGRAESRLKLRVRFNPDFVDKHKAVQGMIRNEKMQKGQDGDWYGLVFWGPLGELQWKGSQTAAKGPEQDNQGSGGGQKAPENGEQKK